MPARVVVATPLLPAARTLLDQYSFDVVVSDTPPADGEKLRGLVGGANAIVCSLRNEINQSVLDAAGPTLKVVSNVAVGVDNIDLAAARRAGVVVCNTPGVLDAATADLTMLLLLAVVRRLPDALELLRSQRWDGFDLSADLGTDLAGRTLGLVGYGRIGRRVADRAKAFEMEVMHHTRRETGVPGYVADLAELLSRSDVVSLHVPLTAATFHLLDANRLALLREGAVLINTARGAVVDETALIAALAAGQLGGAGLDVFEREPHVPVALREAPNVVLTPHIGSATTQTRVKMAVMAVEAVVEVLEGRPYPYAVAAVDD